MGQRSLRFRDAEEGEDATEDEVLSSAARTWRGSSTAHSCFRSSAENLNRKIQKFILRERAKELGERDEG